MGYDGGQLCEVETVVVRRCGLLYGVRARLGSLRLSRVGVVKAGWSYIMDSTTTFCSVFLWYLTLPFLFLRRIWGRISRGFERERMER